MHPAFEPAREASVRGRKDGSWFVERSDGFVLLEVVFAIGILSLGILTVIGFFPMMAKTDARRTETDDAVQTVAPLLAQLRSLPFDTTLACLKTSVQVQSEDNDSSYDPALDDQLFYSDRSGERIGRREDAVWSKSAAERYYEIALIRNDDLSPAARDDLAPWIAFTIRVRWPLFFADAPARPGDLGSSIDAPMKVDRSQQSALLFSGSLRR